MIIKNANIITMGEPNQIIENGVVVIGADGKIKSIPKDKKEIPELSNDKHVLDAGGQYLLPGGICAHTHFYGAFSRGMYIPGDPTIYPTSTITSPKC